VSSAIALALLVGGVVLVGRAPSSSSRATLGRYVAYVTAAVIVAVS
jgi:hypothetical protein